MQPSKGRSRFGVEFLLGAALYVASFFLPAVVPTKQGVPLPGYTCAWIALLILTFLPAGLVNPILVTYATLVGLAKPRTVKLTRVLARILVGLILFTIVEVVVYKMELAIGFYVWVGSLLIMTVPKALTNPLPEP